MPTTLYEIVMLPDGDVVLQRSDAAGEPLVRIRFSDEARHYLGDSDLDVARAMIDAGIEVVEQIGVEGGLTVEATTEPKDRTLH